MSEKKKIKIRGLTVNDCRMLQSLMEKFIADSNDKWLSKLSYGEDPEAEGKKEDPEAEGKKEDPEGKMITLFVEIFQDIISKYHVEATEWFAGLIGVSVEEYGALPFDTDMVVLEQIKEAEEFTNFFKKASVMFKLKRIFGDGINKMKEKYDSATKKLLPNSGKQATQNTTSEAHSTQKKKQKKKKRG